MAQFRVEFVLDPASGMYFAELYHPEKENEVLVRTEPVYPTQAGAVLGVVQLFKDAILKFPKPARKRRGGASTSARRKPRRPARR